MSGPVPLPFKVCPECGGQVEAVTAFGTKVPPWVRIRPCGHEVPLFTEAAAQPAEEIIAGVLHRTQCDCGYGPTSHSSYAAWARIIAENLRAAGLLREDGAS